MTPADVKPSPGCGGGGGTPTIANSLVTTPTGYDGSTPVPAVIAFHPAGNGNDNLKNFFGSSAITKEYLMVYPAAADRGGWQMNADREKYRALLGR